MLSKAEFVLIIVVVSFVATSSVVEYYPEISSIFEQIAGGSMFGWQTTESATVSGNIRGCRPAGHVCTQNSPCCSGLDCVEGICKESLVQASTTIARTKQSCPYECCQGDDNYYVKPCLVGSDCIANKCQSQTQQPSSQFPLDSIPIILIVIIIPLFLFVFIFKKKENDWKKIYGK